MKYDHMDTPSLPLDAFKADWNGKIKLYSGSSSGKTSAPAPSTLYDVNTDPMYIEQQKFLDTLSKDIAKNNIKMTPEQIIAALSPEQRSVINMQTTPTTTPDMSSWGQMNIAPKSTTTTIIPQMAPQPTGSPFSGVQSANPAMLSMIQSLLAGSNYLPSGGK